MYIDVSIFSKSLKQLRAEIFKIKFQSLIYNIVCCVYTYMRISTCDVQYLSAAH